MDFLILKVILKKKKHWASFSNGLLEKLDSKKSI